MAKNRTARHQELLRYVNRVVAKTCPPHLRKDQDDIVQTVMIRLNGKFYQVVGSLDTCRERLIQDRVDSRPKIEEELRNCLREIEKACDRANAGLLRERLSKCQTWAGTIDAQATRQEALAMVETSLAWLRGTDLKEVFSETYVNKGIHWAIMDAGKRHRRLAEVSPEEHEGEASAWKRLAASTPSQHSSLIREEISDCLKRLGEAKGRPTYLALMGYEYAEIAEFLELSLPQTDSRIRRGKAFLRECLISKGVCP